MLPLSDSCFGRDEPLRTAAAIKRPSTVERRRRCANLVSPYAPNPASQLASEDDA